MSRFEHDAIVSCVAAAPFLATREDYPWLSDEETQLPTFLATLHDDTQFRFGSLISLNKSIEKIAQAVSPSDSASTQTALFMGLPHVLKGQPASGISKVENSDLPKGTLLMASRNLISGAGLVFAVHEKDAGTDYPIILRAGISTAKQRPRLLGIMGIQQAGGKRRRS